MAEEKKESTGLSGGEQIGLVLFGVFFLMMLWNRIQDFLYYYHGQTAGSLWQLTVLYFVRYILPGIRVFSFIVSALAIWGIVLIYAELSSLNKEEQDLYSTKKDSDPEAPAKNDRWERVIAHLNSANAADWRLAIIEADVMLDELLKSAGYHGETLGERLKSVEKSDFLTIDNAWEAHRVRNQIAHQGAEFPLSDREAKRAIALYESVFKEFKMI